MASTTNMPVGPDTLITIKIAIQGANKKFKIPLKDLGADVLPDKLRTLLQIPNGEEVVFERFSDSAGTYITLDPENTQVFKTLFRAAKAKLKLRLRATLPNSTETPAPAPAKEPASSPPPFPRLARPVSMSILNTTPMSSTTTLNDSNSIRRLATMKSHMSLLPPPKPLRALNEGEAEAPVPRPFIDEASRRDAAIALIRQRSESLRKPMAPTQRLPVRPKEAVVQVVPAVQSNSWSVYCNTCDKPMSNEHYHCSVCDEGDYDLCGECVDAGVHCPGQDHWLVKRFMNNGIVVSSTTERIAPQKLVLGESSVEVGPAPQESPREMPGAFKEEKKVVKAPVPTRTCNCCINVLAEHEFVHCEQCEDYDLCMECHIKNKSGHHPAHAFVRATPDASIGPLAEFLCAPGRNIRHHALCDGCDKFIYGVRHKCLDCPDWDFCSQCIKSAKLIHPMHRFAPVYEPLDEPRAKNRQHHGIYCDGPLCKDKENSACISGIRYKCAVCDDTDFCANCEAHPRNKHNPTHPLIKFKTPVRNVSVTTLNEDHRTSTCRTFGDRNPCVLPSQPAAQPKPASPTNNTTPVQTIVDIKPTIEAPPKPMKEKIEIKDLLAEPIEERIKINNLLAPTAPESKINPQAVRFVKHEPKAILSPKYDAIFVRDTVVDATKVAPGQNVHQTWFLRNPGPSAWPAGCSVKYVGGDNMLYNDLDATQVVSREVQVSEEAAFSVVMKAPKRTGTAISYWRLKTPDGTPFGHRLWCHVDVVNRNPTVEDVPETPMVGPSVPTPQVIRPMVTPPMPMAPPMQAPIAPVPMQMMPPSWGMPPNASTSPRPINHVTHKVFENGTEIKHIEDIAAYPAPPPVPAPFHPYTNMGQWNPAPFARPSFAIPPPTAAPGNHALQDYQLQMMLLEQQNKKRLLQARQEQEALAKNDKPSPSTSPVSPPEPANRNPRDYAMQLRMLEQQNQMRLRQAQAQKEAMERAAQKQREMMAKADKGKAPASPASPASPAMPPPPPPPPFGGRQSPYVIDPQTKQLLADPQNRARFEQMRARQQAIMMARRARMEQAQSFKTFPSAETAPQTPKSPEIKKEEVEVKAAEPKIESPKPVESPKVEETKPSPQVDLIAKLQAHYEKITAEKKGKEAEAAVEAEKAKKAKSAESSMNSSSEMIFPTLDKESQASSTHEAAVTAPTSAKASSEKAESVKSGSAVAVSEAPMSPSTVKSDLEIFEDAESVDLDSDDSFLTDEEYDILDASDEESII